MRVELIDDINYIHIIDSEDLDLIGRWFAEKVKRLISANVTYNHPVRMHIWPTTVQEHNLIGHWQTSRPFTQENILALAEYLTNISSELLSSEKAGTVE